MFRYRNGKVVRVAVLVVVVTLKLVFNVSSDDQGSHSDDLSISVDEINFCLWTINTFLNHLTYIPKQHTMGTFSHGPGHMKLQMFSTFSSNFMPQELLLFANFLGLESVCQICGDYLVRKLAPENAIRTVELAYANNQHKLMTQVSRYAAKHIVLVKLSCMQTNKTNWCPIYSGFFLSFLFNWLSYKNEYSGRFSSVPRVLYQTSLFATST